MEDKPSRILSSLEQDEIDVTHLDVGAMIRATAAHIWKEYQM